MAKLFYCNTIYKHVPAQDMNPLILAKYRDGQILALCARDGMVTRLSNFIQSDWYLENYPDQVLTPYGWWEAQTMGLVDERGRMMKSELNAHDAVVIIGRDRVDKLFHPLMKAVERHLRTSPKSCA